MTEISNKKILDLFATPGKKEIGFSLLVKKYHKQIYWHIRHMVLVHEDANDLVQDVFLKIWKNLNKFKGNSDLYTWIYRITVNETLAFLKKKKKSYSIEENYESVSKISINSTTISGNDIESHLQKALYLLPPKQRTVFELKYFQQMKYEDMSKILNVTIGSLKASYHHAVKKIKHNVQLNLNLNDK